MNITLSESVRRLKAAACEVDPRELTSDIITVCQALELAHKDSLRLKWLHTCNVPGQAVQDAEGWEWGVAKLKFDKHGQMLDAQWGLSDSSDIDALMGTAMDKND
jgi:hypothetical protein